MTEARLSSDLPAYFARLYDYHSGKFETPLDERGIADIDALVELAIRTYPDKLPSFYNSERDRHHVYWTELEWKRLAAAQSTFEDRQTVTDFRNSPPQIAYVPKDIHAWIEESQFPPPVPPMGKMRRRNAAWLSAALLLKSAYDLDQARTDYAEKKDKPRRVLGHIVGITPVSKRNDDEYIDIIDNEYWLSELNSRLAGWRKLAAHHDDLPTEYGFLPTIRLSDVRNLRRRIRKGAVMPNIPPSLLSQVA